MPDKKQSEKISEKENNKKATATTSNTRSKTAKTAKVEEDVKDTSKANAKKATTAKSDSTKAVKATSNNKKAATSNTSTTKAKTAKSTTSKTSTAKSTATNKVASKSNSTKVSSRTNTSKTTSAKSLADSAKSSSKVAQDSKQVKSSNKKETITASKASKDATKEKVASKVKKEPEEIKPKESVIISKIKSFLKKIVELQEEEKKEKIKKSEQEAKKIAEKAEKEVKEEKNHVYNIEYYDLPYRYNETVVKILAQTPKRLFVYWDVSDKDRERYMNIFGENFFNDTYPVLLIHNEEKNYTFEVPINDFANSWYLDINDSKSKYTIQLGRKFKEQSKVVTINREKVKNENIVLQNDYLPITTSNTLEVPNDHILFENLKSYVIYRNVKTYEEKAVDISNLEFAKKMGKIYNIYEVYKEIYKNEMADNSLLDLLNPSSMSSSSFR